MRGRRIPPGVVALGLVSLLMDTSSELIHGLLPAFMSTAYGFFNLMSGLAMLIASDTMPTRRPAASVTTTTL